MSVDILLKMSGEEYKSIAVKTGSEEYKKINPK